MRDVPNELLRSGRTGGPERAGSVIRDDEAAHPAILPGIPGDSIATAARMGDHTGTITYDREKRRDRLYSDT